jgi:hypothetical protein
MQPSPKIRYDASQRIRVPYQTLRAIGILGARYDALRGYIGKVHHQVSFTFLAGSMLGSHSEQIEVRGDDVRRVLEAAIRREADEVRLKLIDLGVDPPPLPAIDDTDELRATG